MGIPSLMLLMSAFMKLSGSEMMIQNLTKVGLGNYVTFLGVIELVSVTLFLFPKTARLDFYCCALIWVERSQ